uniref:Af2-cadherin n=1 Tax=Artemia franciscana TaxID=6661 RepID=Q5CCS5_ARTSF|nr:Af2-cadherin [Artemia franciscana]
MGRTLLFLLFMIFNSYLCEKLILVLPSDATPGYTLPPLRLPNRWKIDNSSLSKHFSVLDDGGLMYVSYLPQSDPIEFQFEREGDDFGTYAPAILYVADGAKLAKFERDFYGGSVQENLPAGSAVQGLENVRAYPLIKNLTCCEYRLKRHRDKFRLVPNGGGVSVLTNESLDREMKGKYHLLILAYAHGITSEISSVPLTIVIEDVNNNEPRFTEEVYEFLYEFTASRPLRVGNVKAWDPDGTEVTYFLAERSNNAVIEPQTGSIFITNPELRSLEILIGARDRGVPSRNTSVPARARVTFYKKEHGVVKRHAKRIPRGSRTMKRLEFSESDGGTEGKLMFQLEKESERERFKLKDENPWITVEPNGNVRVKKKWDYEELGPDKNIDFYITITNNEGDTDIQRVVIQVRDVNDEAPYFVNRPLPMQAVVQLNAPPNTPVFTLQARDPDTDHNIHYFLVRDRTGGRFEVDERSGVVRTRGTEPFQLDMEYVLYVKAEDQNGRIDDRRYQSTPEERLSIVGGKRPPQFYMPTYEAEIPENQKKDTDIISVRAKSFAERDIRYTLKAQGGQGAGTFTIGPTTGNVRLAKELDFEDLRQPHIYSLVVTATEDSGGFSTSVELTIRVTDVNDNAPKFELPDYQSHNVEEDLPIGTSILKVKATDADSGDNAEIEYSVSDDNFQVDQKGVISNARQLDADNNNAYYEFTVTAKDKGEPPKTGTATVRIYTRNKNDEEPKFSQTVYTPNVDENAGPSTLVTTVVASDKDGDNVRFGFVGGKSKAGQFVIEELTGVIRLHNGPINLDRDKYELNVTATDDGACCGGGGPRHTSTAVVVVFITDVNDNKPIFHDCSTYSPKIEEGAPNGSPVIKVHATDADKGVNGQVKYSIVQQPNQKGTKFTVDEETGEVYTNKVFDREGDDGKFVSVTVKATDQGDPSLEGVCSFTVEITDVNDNPPLFDRQKYVENVKQDTTIGTNILRVSASDEDADNNGAIIYNLTAPYNPSDIDYFSILPESGWIVLTRPLDRETYKLEAIAMDRGFPPLSRTVEVQIDVVDRANNPPVWDQTVYGPIFVKENRNVGDRVVSVKASSGIENNPTVFYRLIRGSTAQTNKYDTFYLQQRNDNGHTWADIKVNHPLDYESIKEYNLTIRVENNGVQQLGSEATIYIVLEDVNDEIPLFTEREQETVLEGEPIGTPVTRVNAIDKDGTFPNNQVFYGIVRSPRNEGRDYFEINEQTGEIFTKVVFDREKQGAYALEVEARDGAPSARPNSNGQPNSVTKYIRIGIADKNDNPPYFDKALYEAEVDENEDIQHTVLTVTAKDLDESSRIRYEITRGNIGGAFAVKNMTGAIYVAGPLDYETRKRYELTLVASDSLNEVVTTVTINIADANDLPPSFDQSTYSTTIQEELSDPLPFKLLKVTATDGDKDRPQNIVYFLTGQGIDPENPSNHKFDINRTTGEIYVLKPLDRDQPHGRPQWRFTVFAQDEGGEGLVGYADVQVNLKDINDNAPIFPLGVYFGNVTENGTAGMVVMTMTAVDYDDPNEGANAKLTYSIEKNVIDENTGTPIFEIEPETGVIKTAVCCLDREKTPDYAIQVVAMDGTGLKGTGTASIRVKDINDMPPQFSKSEWYTEVDETEGTLLPDTPILTVTVLDEDETNKFHYKVIESSGYGADKFTMVRNSDGTGSLKVVQPLDYEDKQQRNGFRFMIQVNDKGEDNDHDKYHVAYSWVNVKVRDINDNKPIFERANIEVSVYENAEIGKSLETFKATDPDQGGKSKVSYAIDRASDRRRQFFINTNGTVTIQRSLDREDLPRHQVKILAIDDGIPTKTATATLTVVVLDINDNAPRFLKDYRPVLPEHVPPRKVIEILATDGDDRSKGNGPPFYFRMDPNADDEIRASFKVEHDPKGANGDGMALVSSLRSFDREQQKEYHVPIVIKDSGSPAMSATSTLTIVIGDVNDNKMQPGSKEIFVYNYMGQAPDVDIGRVYVYDLDDWDLPDKKFHWYEGREHPNFGLDESTGMIKMLHGTREGKYHLRFKAYDRKHTQTDIHANVTVVVREISYAAVINSGSIRLSGTTDEDFVRIWDYKTQDVIKSKLQKFREKLASMLSIPVENVDVFSVQMRQERPPITDIRFSAHGSPYYKAERLNGIVLQRREELESEVGINITMVSIDECLQENYACIGSCTNIMEISALPVMVNANKTSLVGVRVDVLPECTCGARNFTAGMFCRPNPCFNGGRCTETRNGAMCQCPSGYDGPRCQQTTRNFRGHGYAWYPSLEMCENSHLSIEFLTKKGDGLLLYNGPIVLPEPEEMLNSDFIALELRGGYPRLLIDFGSGTLELRVETPRKLDDMDWHRIDIFWDTENVRMIVDHCRTAAVYEPEDGTPASFNTSNCESKGAITPYNEYLNLNTPLQVGGLAHAPLDPTPFRWSHVVYGKGFDGCIKNIIHNSKMYDLAEPGITSGSAGGCHYLDDNCSGAKDIGGGTYTVGGNGKSVAPWYGCGEHGVCVGPAAEPRCECKPGWTGLYCNVETVPAMFNPQSYVKYALSFEPDRFTTSIQLRFRTREEYGELFRVSDQHTREYGILEIRDSRLRFRYNLNSLRTEERSLWLSAVNVNDGQWHSVKVNRHGSSAMIELDGGEGRRYNETFAFGGHQWMQVDKQEGVYAGGKAEYTGVRSYEVYADFHKGCLDDIRLEGKVLPLPPALNGTQWGQATLSHNIRKGCPSNNPCASVTCDPPFECIDLWMGYECSCGESRIRTPDGRGCIDRDECINSPCLNGGVCLNREPFYVCACPEGYLGDHCELLQQGRIVRLSMGALAAILVCLLVILVLVLIYVVYSRRREAAVKYPGPDDDVRENIINYEDEGGGEDDMTAYDITPLQIPIGGPPVYGLGPRDLKPLKSAMPYLPPPIMPGESTVGMFIEEHKRRADNDTTAPPFDDLRNYAYEGGGSTAGSLSSLASGTDDDEQEFDYLSQWGQRFGKLADLYGHNESDEDTIDDLSSVPPIELMGSLRR